MPRAASESPATTLIPDRPTLEKLRQVAAGCTACELHSGATQTVFGEGLEGARVMFVGEQPGDREDVEGHPFVGPAGKELDRGLQAAGIERKDAYATNVVKHFNFYERGRRRIHQKPGREHIVACRPWLDADLETVQPEVLVCLGATAGQAIFGPSFRVTRHRGELIPTPLVPHATATIHPSAILRVDGDDEREAERQAFADDLGKVAGLLT